MWYHDHAVGITRLNAYAGIASGLLIRDNFEAGLIGTRACPTTSRPAATSSRSSSRTRSSSGRTSASGPDWIQTWPGVTTAPGSLWYAHDLRYRPAGTLGGPGGLPLPDPSAIPEFFGDTMLVNGTVYPQATVQARRYRLRLLNACNARFLNLQLYVD